MFKVKSQITGGISRSTVGIEETNPNMVVLPCSKSLVHTVQPSAWCCLIFEYFVKKRGKMSSCGTVCLTSLMVSSGKLALPKSTNYINTCRRLLCTVGLLQYTVWEIRENFRRHPACFGSSKHRHVFD